MITPWPLQKLGQFCTVASLSRAWYQSWQITSNCEVAKISRLWSVCKAFLLPHQLQGARLARESWPLSCISFVRRWFDLYSVAQNVRTNFQTTTHHQLKTRLFDLVTRKHFKKVVSDIFIPIAIQPATDPATDQQMIALKILGMHCAVFAKCPIEKRNKLKLSIKRELIEKINNLFFWKYPALKELFADLLTCEYNSLIYNMVNEIAEKTNNMRQNFDIVISIRQSNPIQLNTIECIIECIEDRIKHQTRIYLFTYFVRLFSNFVCVAADRKKMLFPKKPSEWIFSVGTIMNIYHDFKVILHLRVIDKALSAKSSE